MSAPRATERRHVRVWFGSHVIASYTAEPALAAQYAVAMGRRFAGLRITNDPIPAAAASTEPLPSARLWDIAPH
jgi:hypothetical protein